MSIVGIGTDLLELDRARHLLDRKGEQAMTRLLTEAERAYLRQRPDPVPHFAVRLAAKEAVYKALQCLPGARAVGWRDIEVCRNGDGRPMVELHGLARELIEAESGAGRIVVHLSLSHSPNAAGAVAVIERLD